MFCAPCRADYPSAEHTPTKKVRKRKKKGSAITSGAAQENSASLELALQLEELGLPSAFGTSKAS